jgi:hypothetical protein
MIDRPMFRKNALDRLASPEELDSPFTVVRLPGWVLVACLGVLCLVTLVWGTMQLLPESAVNGHSVDFGPRVQSVD